MSTPIVEAKMSLSTDILSLEPSITNLTITSDLLMDVIDSDSLGTSKQAEKIIFLAEILDAQMRGLKSLYYTLTDQK